MLIIRKIIVLLSVLGLQTLYAQNASSIVKQSSHYVSVDTSLNKQFFASTRVKRTTEESSIRGAEHHFGYYKRENFIKRLFGDYRELEVVTPTNVTKNKSIEVVYIANPNPKQIFWIQRAAF